MPSKNLPVSEDPVVSFNTFNIPPAKRKVQETFFGKIRAFGAITAFEWVYLGISLIGLTSALGITIERLVILPSTANDFTFALYFLLTIVFCFYYVIHAVLTERPDELSIYVICNLIALIYCIANYVMGTRNVLKLARLIVVCVMSGILVPSGIYQTYKYVTSNYLIYHTVGGKTELHDACRMYYICSTLLKFDLQLQLTMLILVRSFLSTEMTRSEIPVLVIGTVVTLAFVVLGFVGISSENKPVMAVFFILGLWQPGYVVYKFVCIHIFYINGTTYCSNIVCGVISLLVWTALITCTGCFTKKYFNKGLKEKMFGHEQTDVPQTQTSDASPAEEKARLSPSSIEQPVDAEIDVPLH